MIKNSTTNQFTGGLVMDLNPIVTPNNVLTDALNATIFTNNGNEGVLQNDMGNGRVETAYLPEGYIPVGSCEFGDIIYIASYNPLINKCQLGCFPSPQRNVSSSSVSDLKQSLDWTNFQEGKDEPNGFLKTNSVKKIIYQNNLSAGDKYIVAGDTITNKDNLLSDLGNTGHVKDDFPKLYKIKLVSIEEDGKITELTNGLKWYNTEGKPPKDFFIKDGYFDRTNPKQIDLDEWRSAVNSAWCIFSSKVSGKLAILAELESISGFSCTWGCNITENHDNLPFSQPLDDFDSDMMLGDIEQSSDIKNNSVIYENYNIYFNINWETENNNINPSGIILTESHWLDIPEVKTSERNSVYIIEPENIKPYSLDENGNLEYPSNYYDKPLNIKYHPDQNISYQEFDNDYRYDTYLEKKFEYIKEEAKYEITKKSKIIRDNSKEDGYYYFDVNKIIQSKDDNGNIIIKYYNTNYSSENAIQSYQLTDDIVNNTFQYPIKKELGTFIVPNTQNIINNEILSQIKLDLSNCVYKYKLSPYMPYGILDQYAQEGTIDFSKINTTSIKLNTWKYYTQTGYSTLTWGLEAYTKNTHRVSKVTIEFYDNFGKAAALHVPQKDSYNGIFTNYIALDVKGTANLNEFDHNNDLILHQGSELTRADLVVGKTYLYKKDNKWNQATVELDNVIEDGEEYCENDSGIIYANKLYLAKVCIDYSEISPLDTNINTETKYFYRWYWTTTIFNDKYYQLQDFENAQFTLELNPQIEISTITDCWKLDINKNEFAENPNDFFKTPIDPDMPNSLSAIKQTIWPGELPNVKIKVSSDFQDNHNVFSLKLADTIEDNPGEKLIDRISGDDLNYKENTGAQLINVNLYLGKETVSEFPVQSNVQFTQDIFTPYNGIQPKSRIGKDENLKDPEEIVNTQQYSIMPLAMTGNLGPNASFGNGNNFNADIIKKQQDTLKDPEVEGGNENYYYPNDSNPKTTPPDYEADMEVSPEKAFEPWIQEKPKTLQDKEYYYVNRFNFGFVGEEGENGDWDHYSINKEKPDPKLDYLNSNLEIESLEEYDGAIKNLYYSYTNGFYLRFFGEHYSKYYFTNKGEYQDARILESFINNDSDYKYYNLDSTTGAFNKCAAIEFYDLGTGEDQRYGLPILTLKYTTKEGTITGIEYVDKDDYKCRSGDRDARSINGWIWQDYTSGILKTFPFLFPYIFARENDEHETRNPFTDATVKNYGDNKTHKLSPNLNFSNNNNGYRTYLGCIAAHNINSKSFLFADQINEGFHVWTGNYDNINIYDASPIFYGLRVSTILKNCFYFNGYQLDLVYPTNNWAYLDPNYSQYNRDIIVSIEPNYNEIKNQGLTENNCILFNGWNYDKYIKDIKNNCNLEISLKEQTKIFNSSNINLKLNPCQKTFPFTIQFEYIKPSTSYVNQIPYTINCVDQSIHDRVLNLVSNNPSLELKSDTIYCAAYINNKPYFGKLEQDCRFLVDNTNEPNQYCGLTQEFIKKLDIIDNRMTLTDDLNSSGKYSVKLAKSFEYADFPKKLTIFTPKDELEKDTNNSD